MPDPVCLEIRGQFSRDVKAIAYKPLSKTLLERYT